MSTDDLKIPKLFSENYHLWAIRSKAALIQRNCWEAISPGYNETLTADEKKVNDKTLSFLFLVVEDDYLDDIGSCEKAKEAWEILEELNLKFGLLHIMQLVRDFFSVEMKPGECMKDYLGRIMEIHRKLVSGNHGFKDSEIALVMLMGLPKSYEPLILNLEQDEESLTTKKVKSRLLVEEKQMLRRDEDRDDNEHSAKAMLIASDKFKQRSKGSTQQEGVKPEVKFQNNAKKSHFERGKCFVCGKPGHFAKDCSEGYGNGNKGPKSDNVKNQKVKMAVHRALRSTKETCEMGDVWILDSGATDHMTSHRGKLSNFRPFTSTVEVANKESIQVMGTGSVSFMLQEINGDFHVNLDDVLYVPELDGNLLSVGRFEEKGMTVSFSNGQATVSEEGENLLFTAERKERLYQVKESSKPLVRVAKQVTESKWHQRLGHVNKATIKKMGLSKGEIHSDDDKCQTCIRGKLRRQSFPTGEATRAEGPLELVHSDVVGKVEPVSKGGSNYFVTFVDDYTHYTTVYPMKKKSQVLEKLDEFRRSAENYHNCKMKVLRSDNGGEYKGIEFDDYMKRHGITRQYTVPHTPQQNGVAERMNQTLLDMVRCLIIDSNIPRVFWADVLDTACHIRNKCSSNAIDGKIPEELWTGKSVKLNYLRVYGCRVWSVINPKFKRKKLDPKATDYVLIGYPKGVKGYKLWDPKTDQITVSRDVIFEENVFPCRLRGSNEETLAENDIIISIDEEHQCDEIVQKDDQQCVREHQEVNHQEEQHELINNEGEEQVVIENGEQIPVEPIVIEQPAVPMVRRSDRIIEKQQKKNQVCNSAVLQTYLEDPETIERARLAPDSEKWREAVNNELANLKKNETWEVTARPPNKQIVKCKWVFKKKFDGDGKLDKYKARLVACGYTQVKGVDYKETYSPVVKTKSIRALLGIAVERQWYAHQMDITAAYLNGTLKEMVYMELPKLFDEGQQNKNEVCLLKRSIYGLHQSGREWNLCLDEFLKSINLVRSKADPCVYFNEEKTLIIGVYVDDLLIIAKNEDELNDFKRKIGEKFEAKDLGMVNHILSIRVIHGENGEISLDQTTYTEELLKNFKMESAKGAATPLEPGMKYERGKEDPTEDLAYEYRQAIGGLLYLSGGTRPDLAFTTAYMSQFSDKPTREHWTGVKHIFRYLRNTKDWGLQFQKTGKGLEVFGDADWASDKVDRRSFSGYVIKFAGAAISWSSKKQRTTALSTVEAEYIAMCHVAKEVIWMKNFFEEIGAEEYSSSPQPIHVDNQGAIIVAKNQVTSERNKHIELRHYFLREKVQEKILSFDYVPTDKNLADMLTKVLTGKKTRQHCEELGLLMLGSICQGGVLESIV